MLKTTGTNAGDVTASGTLHGRARGSTIDNTTSKSSSDARITRWQLRATTHTSREAGRLSAPEQSRRHPSHAGPGGFKPRERGDGLSARAPRPAA
jgi:hypothetical protein